MKNSDILYLYDAKMSNPNGDPDDENRPRMDYERFRNLVSDVRLKRYIRDYLEQKGHEIFVSKLDGNSVTATDRLTAIAKEKKLKKADELPKEVILERLIDVRMFGATMPIKNSDENESKGEGEGKGKTKAKGSSMTFTGPIQFNWGYSLNEVELMETNGLTSHFTSESDKQQGAMAKDYRVYYSLIAFHGIITAKRAEHTQLKPEDVVLLREALVKAIPLLATRSKIGQYPRLLMQVEYTDDETLIGDLRDFVSLATEVDSRQIREIKDYQVDISQLIQKLVAFEDRIAKIYLWQDSSLTVTDGQKTGLINELLPVNLQTKVELV